MLYGAILGDIVGSLYEFNNYKAKDFPLFSKKSHFTDDTVMTLAVAKGFLDADKEDDDSIRSNIVESMTDFALIYPCAGYGGRFYQFLFSKNPRPYNSYGNGSAMRVSAAAWFYDDLESVIHAAKLSAEVSHNHLEGIKGAQATAAAIFLARKGYSKKEIKEYIEMNFGYALNFTLDEIRPVYEFDETCQGTVPQAIQAFLESTDFEDAIRNAISIGGDSDTLAAIAGSIAEAYYGVQEQLKEQAKSYLTEDLLEVLYDFERSK